MDKFYIVKNLTPWMMDEIIAFSSFTRFKILFLRKPSEQEIYYLTNRTKNSAELIFNPYRKVFNARKILFIIYFIVKNLKRFRFNYNGVIGLKSIIWFLRVDPKILHPNISLHAQFATQPALFSYLVREYYKGIPKLHFTYHAHDIYMGNTWLTLLLSNCECAFSISKYNIDYVKRKYTDSDKIELCPLGIFPIKKKIYEVDEEGNHPFIIGFLSRLIEKKGLEYLLESIKYLKEENIKLLIAGDGPLEETMKKRCDELEISEKVKFLGSLDSEQKDKFFNGLDLFVLPSITTKDDMDGLPVVLMEAIAYGLPIISTNISGIPEICINNYNGYLIKEKDVNQLRKSILSIKNSQSTQNKFKSNSLILSKDYDIINNSKKKIDKLGW